MDSARRTAALGLTVCVLAAAAAALAGDSEGGRFTYRGTVTRVVDGDTLDVRLGSGVLVRVRAIGIDTPERGSCFAAQATARTRALAFGRAAVLKGDPTQATRDRYGRLLAYVWIGGARDLGYRLIAGGFARSYVVGRPFQRLAPYRQAERSARTHGRGLWAGCAGPAPTAGGGTSACHASYSPCLPVVADLDCGEIADALKPITVTGGDPYRLDADGDGLGCE